MAAVNLIAHSSTPYQRLARQTPKFGRIVDSPARIFYNSNMNRFAYRTTGLAIKAFQWLSKANLKVHGAERIPQGARLFVINHFTRIETLLMPYYLDRLTGAPVWSLADYELFKGALGSYLDSVGAVSTRDPDRDRLIVKTLLTGEASWIIYPEGRMVKNKKIVEKGRYMISYAGGKPPPHTGAATLAMRTEFYRQRLRFLSQHHPQEARRLLDCFEIETIDEVVEQPLHIIPVNLTYYPIRAKENVLSFLARKVKEGLSERLIEELMAEGTMFLSGVDIDMRFGEPIPVGQCLGCQRIDADVKTHQPIDFNTDLGSRRQMRREALRLMQQYMRAIYSMTTVNHDHLFASMLRLVPRRRIDQEDLKRKVYLGASSCQTMQSVKRHQSLASDQLPLLTDDRYHKYRDFMTLARQTEVVSESARLLRKNTSRLTHPIGFDRDRVDNPVWVIANEVEPLTELQHCLRRIAWQPAWYTRRTIARFLHRKATEEFDKDYREFEIPGESHDPSIGRPFLLKGRSRQVGVVVVHGYMAAPAEVKELALYLQRKGCWVYAPRVKGHGTAPEDLARCSYRDWIRSVEYACALMQCHCRRVIVGGFSNGAGLALEAASRLPGVAGVFAVSPPLQLQDFSAHFAPAVNVWNRIMKRMGGEAVVKEFVDNDPENPHINYHRNPIAGIRELERLMDLVDELLARVTVPALVVQAAGDPVVNSKGSRKVFDKLGARDKKYVLFNFERHGILLGPDAAKVHQVIYEFVADVRRELAAATS